MIVWANKKGGVGKSTLAGHNAVWKSDQGFKTALLDADEQRSSSRWIARVEPKVTIAVADTPEKCVPIARQLMESHDFVIADAPGGVNDITRTLLILADLAVFPVNPSIFDLWSVAEATELLRYAQGINRGRPDGRLVLNKMESRTVLSRELREAAPQLGVTVATNTIRDLLVYREVVKLDTVVSRVGRRATNAAADVHALFSELFGESIQQLLSDRRQRVQNG